MALVVVGSFFGDEGKGKLVDALSKDYDIVARAAGGNNSAHTICVNGKSYVSRLIPCAFLSDEKICFLGGGMVINLSYLMEELENFSCFDRTLISESAHITFPFHRRIDYLQDMKAGISTTCRGVGPSYSDKVSRRGLRIGDLLCPDYFTERYWKLVNYHLEIFPELAKEYDLEEILRLHVQVYAVKLANNIVDSLYLAKQIKLGKKVLVECSQAAMLDIDHGEYPYVTSSSTGVAGAISGLALNPKFVESIGVCKAVITRVASSAKLATEFTKEEKEEILASLQDKQEADFSYIPPLEQGNFIAIQKQKFAELDVCVAKKLHEIDGSHRPRTCGWFDCVLLEKACIVNGFSSLCLNKLDCLSGLATVKVCLRYEDKKPIYKILPGWKEDLSLVKSWDDLPKQAQDFIFLIEERVGVPIKYIGVGKDRKSLIKR